MPTDAEITAHTAGLVNLPNMPFDGDKHTTIFAEDLKLLNSRLGAWDTKLGANPEAGYTNVQDKFAAVFDEIDALISNLNTVENSVLQKVFPVGSIYASATVSTSPATLLGFGTWVVFSAGRTLVGKASSGTFSSAGAEVGAETHVLTTSELPAHTHGSRSLTGYIGAHGAGSATVFAQSATGIMYNAGGRSQYRSGGSNIGGAGSVDGFGIDATHTHDSVGSNAAHNNIQPSIVVYMWRRTA